MALTAEEKAELASLEAEVSGSKLTPDEHAELIQLEKEVGSPQPDAEAPMEEEAPTNTAMGFLKTAGRVLDYPSGLARTAAAQVSELAPQVPAETVTGEDWIAALKGEAPTSSEYYQRAGVPAGPEIAGVSARDVGGFATDVALDPLAFLSKTGRGVEKIGERIYKSGLKQVDERVLEKGAKPLSELLLEKGAWGKPKTLEAKTQELFNKAVDKRTLLYSKADKAGVLIDPQKALGGALLESERIAQADKNLRPLMDDLQLKLNTYISEGPVPVSRASEWKSNIASTLPESAFDKFGRTKGPVKDVQKLAGSGFKKEIEQVPELGKQIKKANQEMQTVYASRKPLRSQVRAETKTNPVTAVDVMLGGSTYAMTHDPLTTAGIAALKKAADISKTTAARTGLGLATNRAGKYAAKLGDFLGPVPPIAARGIYQSPWLQMQDKKEK